MIAFLVSFLLVSLYGVQVECKVESYSLEILEKGTRFYETVEVDVASQTEVFRVPQHNDVDAMEMMNDFKEGLTVRRIPSAGACYVSHLDLAIPQPEQIKISLRQMSLRGQPPSNVTTTINGWRVVGFASRFDLPQTFIDFCYGYPIYGLKKTSLDSVKFLFKEDHRRGKRHHILNDFSTCSTKGKDAMENCLSKQNEDPISYSEGRHVEYNMKCSYKVHNCFYVYDCKPLGSGGYKCDQAAHFLEYLGICCYPVC